MSNRKDYPLDEIRARLDALVAQRTQRGLDLKEETEYRELISLEAEALAVRGDFGRR